jgi:hypothetical protein
MPETVELCTRLNGLLVDLNRSLLQYVGECWPWTDLESNAERQTLHRLVRRQQEQIRALTDWLARRGWPIDFGTYPTEYTDLHYVSLDYLLVQLTASESALVEEAQAFLARDWDSPQAVQLVERVLAEEQAIDTELQKLAASRRQPAGV